MRLPKKPLAIAEVEDEHRATTFGGLMKRVASILTGLSLAVLFCAASAHAQSEQRVTANIPFDFAVGSISLPAGQYEFTRTGVNLYLVRDADGRSLFTAASNLIEPKGRTDKSALKFNNVSGHHVLVQIWNDLAGVGNEFQYGHPYEELANRPTIDGNVVGRH
jgi:hypothetical protein